MTDLISDQLAVVDLASWADAWLHEQRGFHGEWVKAGEGTDRYQVPPHSRLLIKGHGYKDPADHPFFKAHPVSPANIIASYDASTPGERAQGARWYADAHNLAAKMSNGDAREGAILLASYSPQSSWPVNMFNATRSAEERRALGPGDGLITGAMQANAQEALDGKSIDEALTSPKTRAFARLIELGGDAPGDGAGEVVIDRHALNVAAGETLPKAATDKAPIGDARMHEYVSDQYRQAALQISKRDGVVMPPYVLQAITWLHQQQMAEATDAAGGVGRGGAALKKGRVTAIANAWKRWKTYAAAEGIPLTSDTGLAGSPLFWQMIELASDSLAVQIELTGDGHGHHIPGTPDVYRHGFIPVSSQETASSVTAERAKIAREAAGTYASELAVSPAIDLGSWPENLPTNEFEAVSDYISVRGSAALNGPLRAGRVPDPPRDTEMAALDALIYDHVLKQQATVYRGMAMSQKWKDLLKPGAVFSDKGYTSTTTDPRKAANFAEWRSKGRNDAEPCYMQITVPAGYHTAPGMPKLSEYILPRFTRYRVDSVSADGKHFQITVLPNE